MSTEEPHSETPAEWAERTRIAQGLPPRVDDPDCLTQIAALLDQPTKAEGDHR